MAVDYNKIVGSEEDFNKWAKSIQTCARTMFGMVDGEKHEMAVKELGETIDGMWRRPPRWLQAGRKDYEGYGSGDQSYLLWYVFPAEWTDAQIHAELERWEVPVEPFQCTCMHDCCGHWFGRGLFIQRRSKFRFGMESRGKPSRVVASVYQGRCY